MPALMGFGGIEQFSSLSFRFLFVVKSGLILEVRLAVVWPRIVISLGLTRAGNFTWLVLLPWPDVSYVMTWHAS